MPRPPLPTCAVKVDSRARLLVSCPDRPGIVAAVTGFLFEHSLNITQLDEHATRPTGGAFFMRVEIETRAMTLSRAALAAAFEAQVAARFGMTWRLGYASDLTRTVIMVSKQDHAMMELLWRWRRGELPCHVTAVISNHREVEPAVRDLGLPFHHIPVVRGAKADAETALLERLGEDTELIVLARYMQILSPRVVSRFVGRIINIHHSFLPAFQGAKPYHRAYDRGVKLIGATAHYVTDELDEGPIIEQDVIRVTHRYRARDLVSLGRDIERQVLARAVRWHLEDRVLIHDNKTVVFV